MDIPPACSVPLIMLICIAVNALFAFTEISISESSQSKIDRYIENGNTKAIAAAEILDAPDGLLSISQIGITLVSIITGTLSGAFVAPYAAKHFTSELPEIIWLISCTAVITYFNLLLGEFLPKKLALQDPERFLLRFAPFLQRLEKICRPLVGFLTASTNTLLLIFGFNPHIDDSVTEDEVKDLIEQGTEDGTFEKTEQDMIDNIFHLSDQTAYSLMTPRTQMLWLDLEDGDEKNLEIIKQNPGNIFPVGKDNLDAFCGVIYAKDLLNAAINKEDIVLTSFIKKPLLIPRSTETFRVLEKFQETGLHEAVVLDEYGGVVGFITLDDIIGEILGNNISSEESSPAQIIRQTENRWLIDGLCPIDDFKEAFNLPSQLPGEEHDHYQTLGGFLVSYLGCIPLINDTCTYKGFTFEIVAMDRARIAKVAVVRKPKA